MPGVRCGVLGIGGARARTGLTKWSKEKALGQIREVGLIPIVRAPSAEVAMAAAEAIVESGVGILEITMTVPNALSVLREVARRFDGRALIGAGTVLDAKTCRRAIARGAEFIVTPALVLPVIRQARRLKRACIPGALTPTEILMAWRAGADLVKVFPCGPVGGPAYIKANRRRYGRDRARIHARRGGGSGRGGRACGRESARRRARGNGHRKRPQIPGSRSDGPAVAASCVSPP